MNKSYFGNSELWFAFSNTKSIQIDYSGLPEHQLFLASFYGIVLCAATPPPQIIGPSGPKKPFLRIFRRWIRISVWDRNKHGISFYMFFNVKASIKTMFFEVRKKPEGDGEILALDSDSAT